MNDALLMRRLQAVGDLDGKIEQRVDLEERFANWPYPPSVIYRFRSNTIPQGLTFQQLHHDDWLPVMFFHGIYGADVAVVEGRGGARFPLEPLQGDGVVGQLFRQD